MKIKQLKLTAEINILNLSSEQKCEIVDFLSGLLEQL